MSRQEQIKQLEKDWAENPRWANVKRDYSAEDVVRLRGSVIEEYTLATRGAEKLWDLVNDEDSYVNCSRYAAGYEIPHQKSYFEQTSFNQSIQIKQTIPQKQAVAFS